METEKDVRRTLLAGPIESFLIRNLRTQWNIGNESDRIRISPELTNMFALEVVQVPSDVLESSSMPNDMISWDFDFAVTS